MDLKTFLDMPNEEIAQRVRAAAGAKVCVLPANGTRRWLILEHPAESAADFTAAYLRFGGEAYIRLCRLIFDHGIDTLLTPTFGPDLLQRGEAYDAFMIPALLWFGEDPDFARFCETYDVRVRVYGDTKRYLAGTAYEPALEAFAEVTRRTASHQTRRLFIGICAHDPSETVAEIALQFHAAHGRLPKREEIVAAYYGEYVEPVDLFIGFDRPAAFDMPLVAIGSEDLYFTVSPTPYLDAQTLRAILYDHLYVRRMEESSYANLGPEDWAWMHRFYQLNHGLVQGVGFQHKGIWYPLPQVRLPHPPESDEPGDAI